MFLKHDLRYGIRVNNHYQKRAMQRAKQSRPRSTNLLVILESQPEIGQLLNCVHAGASDWLVAGQISQ